MLTRLHKASRELHAKITTTPSSSRHAHQLFDKTHQSNTTHAMLDCIHKNQPSQALTIFKQNLQLGLVDSITQVSLSLALKSCRGNPKLGCQIHGFAVASGFTSYITVSNSLMSMYCKAGVFDRALCIFDHLNDPDVVSWNTVLSGFQRSEDALWFFRRMNVEGVVFDSVSLSTALGFCNDKEDLCFGLQLHCFIVKNGLDFELFVGNALISMYARGGWLAEGRRVFDGMSKRDLVSWNAMLSGYTQEGSYGFEAMGVFVQMVREEGMELDHVSFTGAVSACGCEKSLVFARQVHGLAIKRNYGSHVSVGNVLISTYSKCDLIDDAKSVFECMNERNVISWTTMISMDEGEAIALFNKMRMNGVYFNDVTFIGLIQAIIIRKLVREGESVHGLCIKTSFMSESNVCNSLITMYAKFESMEGSRKVFEELNYREAISWNSLISGYDQNEMYQQAYETFLLAITESQPNQYTFGSVLSAIGSAESISLRHGQRCHSHIMKLGLNNDPIVSGALLDMYAKRGSLHESQMVFQEAPKKSEFAWTAIISAYARHGDYEMVITMFKEMEKEGATPDSITFLSVLTACGRKGMVDMGLQLFNSMLQDYKIEPSPEHYSCIVDMLGRAGRLKEAEKLTNRIPGGPGLSVLQSLLGSCRVYGDVEMAERAANALMAMEPMESGSYVLMSNLYAEKGQWEKVAYIRKGMREKGVKKEIGFSWVDVNDTNKTLPLYGFSSGDNSHPQSDAIRRMAEFIGFEMIFSTDKKARLYKTEISVPLYMEG